MNIGAISGIAKAAAALGAGGLLAVAIALGASGGGNNPSRPQAQVPEETATSVPEGTAATKAASEPESTPVPEESLIPPTDCEDGWLAYEDPDERFSFCYPEDFKLVTDARNDQRAFGIAAYVYPPKATDGNVALAFSWMTKGNSELAGGSVCSSGGGKYPYTSRQEDTRTVARTALEVCFTDTFKDAAKSDLDYRSFAAEFPVTDGGVIRVTADYSASRLQEFEDLALQIVETLRVR